jgi:hypothetical protein
VTVQLKTGKCLKIKEGLSGLQMQRDSGIANAVFGGWELNDLLSMQTGHNFTITIPNARQRLGATGVGDWWPDRIRDPRIADSTPDRCFDTSASCSPSCQMAHGTWAMRAETYCEAMASSTWMWDWTRASRSPSGGSRCNFERRLLRYQYAHFGRSGSDHGKPRFWDDSDYSQQRAAIAVRIAADVLTPTSHPFCRDLLRTSHACKTNCMIC